MFETITDIPGVGAGSPEPPNVAFLWHKRSGFGGRRNRGRMYVPGVEEAVSDGGGNIGVPYQTAQNGALAVWHANIGNTAATNVRAMVIFHSYEWTGTVDPGPPVGFPTPTDVTSITLDPKVATQRRRLRR